jgi:uncharacterized protein YndB with AHSA1/START domain
MDGQQLTLDITETIEIKAPIERAYQALIRRLTVDNSTPDNQPMPMVLEEFPGGRWFRDLGDSQGHLWGFVQVIKPPTLIEIHGPLFMSYAVAGHVQLRLTESADGTEFTLRHRVLGFVEESHRIGVPHGWGNLLQTVKAAAD